MSCFENGNSADERWPGEKPMVEHGLSGCSNGWNTLEEKKPETGQCIGGNGKHPETGGLPPYGSVYDEWSLLQIDQDFC